MSLGSHLLQADQLDATSILELLDLAESFAEVERRTMPKVPALKGKVVATLFFEDSTRTRLSFETAAKRLSADVLSLAVGSSSVKKGESLRDTVETIEAMGIDAIVIRHRSSGAAHQVARWAKRAKVINAGDGWHEHPTQALLDLLTVRQRIAGQRGLTPQELGVSCFEGLRVGIIGDIRHSRVARSSVSCYRSLGAEVTVVAPGSLLPPGIEDWGVKISHDLDAVIPSLDVIALLRLQSERGSGTYLPSLREYSRDFSLSAVRETQLGALAMITHPGPMMRGVEIASSVADLDRTLQLRQVSNGVATRMAVLFSLLGQGPLDSGMEQ
ncbi:MAG: aspartate carbamoyltransferase catalytic subunit [Actinobacteria bacterium]|nr:aspartate carbamoyltransferase catalytic subunit [Actinomycetota bacterium]